jgi:Peptidase family C78
MATALLRKTSLPLSSSSNRGLLPLYLQWEGHSVTVIGVEQTSTGTVNLLVLNPSQKGPAIATALRNSNSNLAPLRLPLARLRHKDTQVLLPSLYSLSAAEQAILPNRSGALTAAVEDVQRAVQLAAAPGRSSSSSSTTLM